MTNQIQIRRDLAANWTSANPTLASGEIGYETNTKKLKLGDGATAWISLPYFPSDSGWLTPTLTSPYSDGSGFGFNPPGYRKIGNVVYLRGLFVVTTATNDQAVFTLPSGYRPTGHLAVSATWPGTDTGVQSVNIEGPTGGTFGIVRFTWTGTKPAMICIDGISFTVD